MTPDALTTPDAHAIDRIAGLHFPSQAPKVLAQEDYWTPACLARFLDAASEFAVRDPKPGREVAQIGVQLAQLVPRCARQRQLLVRSLALLAWTHQACGAGGQGEGIYRTAFELAAHAPLDPRIASDLLRRYASLLRQRDRLDDALEAAGQAVRLLESPPHGEAQPEPDARSAWRRDLGQALTERGRALLALGRVDDAVADLGLALGALDPFRHDFEIGACLDLLAHVADRTRALDRLHRVAQRVACLRELVETHHLRPGTASARLAARVLRLDGTLFQRMGARQRAERSLRHARRLLRGHPDEHELLAVSLDLARLLARDDRQDELLRLSADTLEQLGQRGGLSLTRYRWRRALASGRLDLEEIERIRRAFAEERDAAPPAPAPERTAAPDAPDAPAGAPLTLRPIAVGQ